MPEPTAKPLPPQTPEWAPFFEAAARGVLGVPRCQNCGAFRFPPRPVCPECLATNFAWESVSGRGEVWSYVVMHQVYHPAFAAEVPYAVVLVRLVEGPKIVSRLLDVAPGEIRIGMPVIATFVLVGGGIYLPMFRLANPV
ncbi:MAG: hypothetical protein KatS3mg077_3347 [Candidatus Binatia bacterium]|nr:MAG: hypothetical protein KatS3mg077_3347 [Candidatus Binatia bacterium]